MKPINIAENVTVANRLAAMTRTRDRAVRAHRSQAAIARLAQITRDLREALTDNHRPLPEAHVPPHTKE